MVLLGSAQVQHCNKCTTLVRDADKGEMGRWGKGQRVHKKSLYFLFDFAVNLKLLEKIKCWLRVCGLIYKSVVLGCVV